MKLTMNVRIGYNIARFFPDGWAIYMTESGLTYRDAGVDIDAGDELVERIKPVVKRTMRQEVLAGIGGFGALVEVPLDRYRGRCWCRAPTASAPSCASPSTPAATTRSASTSSRCAPTTSSCQGAEPLFFLDYYATGKLRVDVAEAGDPRHRRRLRAGRRRAGRRRDRRDARHVPRRRLRPRRLLRGRGRDATRIIDGTKTAAGDVVIGLASSGPHSNGYSLIRKLVSVAGAEREDAARRQTAVRPPAHAHAHLREVAARSWRRRSPCKGFAHITGGGLTDNIPRVLPDGFEVVLQRKQLGARSGVRLAGSQPASIAGGRDVSHVQLRHRHGRRRRAGGRRCGAGASLKATGETASVIGSDRARHRAASSSRNDRTLLPVAVVISGRGSNMEAIARAALQPGDSRYQVVRVIADRESAGGLARAAALGHSDRRRAGQAVCRPRQPSTRRWPREIEPSGARLVALAGFMRILSAEFVQRFEGRLLNIHPSLLPKYKGLDTHARALAARRYAPRRQRALRHGRARWRAGDHAGAAPAAGRGHAGNGFSPRSCAGTHHLSACVLTHCRRTRRMPPAARCISTESRLAAPLVEENDAAA